MHLSPIRALRDVNRNLTEQLDAERAAEEAARFEIARSATQFSRRSKEVVDGTINLSAVLMRAGEVEEANRLLAEAEREVRTEEAVLIETVNEVRAEGVERRGRITRLKLLRMLATAFLGGSLMAFSAFGVAVAKFLAEGPPAAGAHEVDAVQRPTRAARAVKTGSRDAGRDRVRRVLVPGTAVRLALSGDALSEYLRLKNTPGVGTDDLREFLLGLAPDELVQKVVSSLASTTAVATAKVAKVVGTVTEIADDVKEKAPKESAPSEAPASEPSESPEDESPSPNGSPSEGGESEDPDETTKDEDGEGGSSMLPEPLPHVGSPDHPEDE